MAQPPFVPKAGSRKSSAELSRTDSYSSPKYVPRSWRPDRPGDIVDEGNPRISGFGDQGPDQGYILMLAERYKKQLHLRAGERESDVLAGCARLALKRASLMGRAPMAEDLEVSFSIFGFLYESLPVELVDFRRSLLSGVAHNADDLQARVSGVVSQEIIKLKSSEIKELQRSDWRAVFSSGNFSGGKTQSQA